MITTSVTALLLLVGNLNFAIADVVSSNVVESMQREVHIRNHSTSESGNVKSDKVKVKSDRSRSKKELKAKKSNKLDKHGQSHDEPENISGPFKYESSMWQQRNLKGDITLNIDAFDEALSAISEEMCDVGLTATLFDENSEEVYQKTVGTNYTPFASSGYFDDGYDAFTEGWTGDTTMTLFSNGKVMAAATYLAAVVDQGLGYLDEPIYLTFPYMDKDHPYGNITPRMILSHTSGLKTMDRTNLSDPYYACKYDSTTTLGDCLQTHFFSGEMNGTPGSIQIYNNEAFDMLAELATLKTGVPAFGDIFKRYIADPLYMANTTYDCPVVKSTTEKPHVAWGGCSTAHDYAKLVQMLSNGGVTLAGEQVLSKYAVTQIFSHGGGNAMNDGDWIWGGVSLVQITRCASRLYTEAEYGMSLPVPAMPLNTISGYGLGTMFMPGNYGQLFSHAGSTGGFWFVAPGRYSGYISWMNNGAVSNIGEVNAYVGDALNTFEDASDFRVSESNVLVDSWEKIEMCGGRDMYVDKYANTGNWVRKVFPIPKNCADNTGRGTMKTDMFQNLMQEPSPL